jgi:hypothetical protein
MDDTFRARRDAARKASVPGDGMEFISTQDGLALQELKKEENPRTVASREAVGIEFLKFYGSQPISVDLVKAFLRN